MAETIQSTPAPQASSANGTSGSSYPAQNPVTPSAAAPTNAAVAATPIPVSPEAPLNGFLENTPPPSATPAPVANGPETLQDPNAPFDIKALKLPQGFTIDAIKDNGLIEALKGLPQGKAQEAANWYTAKSVETMKAIEEQGKQQFRQLQEQSIRNISADATLGGPNFEATKLKTQTFFNKTLERVPEAHRQMVVDYFIKGGVQNLEPVIRFLHAASDSIREDKPLGLDNTSNPAPAGRAKYNLDSIRDQLVRKATN